MARSYGRDRRPGRWLLVSSAIDLGLVSTLALNGWLMPPPPMFFAYLLGATVAYLGLVEVAKAVFYRTVARPRAVLSTAPSTSAQ